MEISIDLSALKRFARKVEQTRREQPDEINVALTKAGLLVEREAKMLTPVRTGRLRASISVYTPLNVRDAVAIGPHTNYAVYVHRRIPFMTAGFYTAKGRIETILSQAVSHSLKKML